MLTSVVAAGVLAVSAVVAPAPVSAPSPVPVVSVVDLGDGTSVVSEPGGVPRVVASCEWEDGSGAVGECAWDADARGNGAGEDALVTPDPVSESAPPVSTEPYSHERCLAAEPGGEAVCPRDDEAPVSGGPAGSVAEDEAVCIGAAARGEEWLEACVGDERARAMVADGWTGLTGVSAPEPEPVADDVVPSGEAVAPVSVPDAGVGAVPAEGESAPVGGAAMLPVTGPSSSAVLAVVAVWCAVVGAVLVCVGARMSAAGDVRVGARHAGEGDPMPWARPARGAWAPVRPVERAAARSVVRTSILPAVPRERPIPGRPL